MSQVLTEIKPYITKKFMAAPYIYEQDIPTICQMLLPKYENVTLLQGLADNKPCFKIQVKGLFNTDEKVFEVVSSKKRKPAAKKSNRNWIDELEGTKNGKNNFGKIVCQSKRIVTVAQ